MFLTLCTYWPLTVKKVKNMSSTMHKLYDQNHTRNSSNGISKTTNQNILRSNVIDYIDYLN